jgi:hypothetical protein
MHKVSPHGKLPVPNDEDYNLDPNTYDREFFQEEGLEGVTPGFKDKTRHTLYIK